MPLVTIDRTAGTIIGNFPGGSVDDAAFDGVTSQASGSCAFRLSSSNGGWIGKTLASPAVFGRAVVYGSNDLGFKDGSGADVTITFRGKTGAAPSGLSDGTVIGTLTFTDTSDESAGRTIETTDSSTAWDHIWLFINSTGGNDYYIAEIVLYKPIPVSQSVIFA